MLLSKHLARIPSHCSWMQSVVPSYRSSKRFSVLMQHTMEMLHASSITGCTLSLDHIDLLFITFSCLYTVSGPNSVTYLNQTSILQWCAVNYESKNGH